MLREELENIWRSRLRDAKLRLDFAHQYAREVERDRTAGDIPAADGNFAFQKAIRAENYAIAEYRRTLRVYADLVLHNKIPGEDQWRESASAETP